MIGILAAAIVVAYVELASTVVLAYAVYVGVLAVRREVDLRPVMRLWLVPLDHRGAGGEHVSDPRAAVREGAGLKRSLVVFGLPSSDSPLFPSALPGMFGLLRLPPDAVPHLGTFILVSMVLLAVVLAASAVTA